MSRVPDGRGSAGSLLERADRVLTEGPISASELARRVMGLQGPATITAEAVRTLLGADPRFRVDGEGRWHRANGAEPPGRALLQEDYAVVDVETTGGGFRSGHRITEISVVEVGNGEIRPGFRSLVNPGRRIPRRVQSLTGITDGMVASAPYFDEIAPRVRDALAGSVFVAHNVRFDWGFVHGELLRAGEDLPELRRLCTVRMARRLVPESRRHNLDAMARHFGLEIAERHRATGDAVAAARLLLRLIDRAGLEGIHDLDGLEAFLGGGRRGGRRRAAAGEARPSLPSNGKRERRIEP